MQIGRSFPNAEFQTYPEALKYLNRAHWNLSLTEHENQFDLYGGDQHLFRGETIDQREAFVLGMALTFSLVGPHELPGFESWTRDRNPSQ